MNGSIVAVPNAYKDSDFSFGSALMAFFRFCIYFVNSFNIIKSFWFLHLHTNNIRTQKQSKIFSLKLFNKQLESGGEL